MLPVCGLKMSQRVLSRFALGSFKTLQGFTMMSQWYVLSNENWLLDSSHLTSSCLFVCLAVCLFVCLFVLLLLFLLLFFAVLLVHLI